MGGWAAWSGGSDDGGDDDWRSGGFKGFFRANLATGIDGKVMFHR